MLNPNPAEFEYIGSYYCGGVESILAADYTDHICYTFTESRKRHPDAHGDSYTERGKFVDAFNGRCDHCGTYHAWGSVFHHTPTDTFVAVGHTCASTIFDLPSEATMRRRKAERQAAKAREAVKHLERAREFVQMAGLPCMECVGYHCGNSWIRGRVNDMWHKLVKYGSLSEKQIEFAAKLIDDAKNPKPRNDEEEEPKPTKAAPRGRVVVTGEVLCLKWKDYGYGEQLKMLIRSDDGGWKLWITCPTSLMCEKIEKGQSVVMTATVEPSDRDEYFAFGKRPTKAAIFAGPVREEK
jgi:hypothetical protein